MPIAKYSSPAVAAVKRTIGIVVTLYDDYHYLGECLAHLVRGSRNHDLKVCLCIDESRYDSAARETVSELIAHYKLSPEVAYNNQGGPAVARNQGIRRLQEKHPTIDYFFFMDADNFVGDGDLDILVSCLESAPEDVVYTYQNIIKFGELDQYVRLDVPFHRWRLLNVFYGETGNLVRAKIFREGQFFHEGDLLARNTGEDVEFFRRLGGLYKGIHCPGTRFHYRTKLVHRDSVYWPKHDILSAWMRQANEEIYAKAEREHFASPFFDVSGIAKGNIADLVADYHADAMRTQRSLLELGRGLLLCLSDRQDLGELQATPLHGLILVDLFRDGSKLPRLFRFHMTEDVDAFRYERRTSRLGVLAKEEEFGLMTLPATACPSFPDCRQWKHGELAVEILDIWSIRAPILPPLTTSEILGFFENWKAYEAAREVSLPAPEFRDVYKFPNHGDWLADQLRGDWRYLSSQRDILRSPRDSSGPRICVVAAMVMVGGSDVATIELLRSLHHSFPDACIDVVFAHFVWSESGSNQGNNFKRLDWISPCVDGIFFADLVQPHLRPAFLRRLLSSYDLIHIETSLPAYWLLKEIKEEGRRPKIVSHLFCWDYHMGLRVGFPVFAPKYADVVDIFSCQTQLVADYLSTRDVPRRKIFWLPYTSRFNLASEPKPISEKLRVLWIGRWVEQKNPGLLVDAMELLLGQEVNLHISVLVIDNFDNERHFDRSRLHRLQKLKQRFPAKLAILSGPVAEAELEKLYLNSDILLSTSAWEGIPFIFYEAMAFGCIPVATDVSANGELIVHEVNGLLVPAGNAEAIAKAVARLCIDHDGLQALRAGVSATRSASDPNEFARQHVALFRTLLAGETPGGYYRAYTLDRGHAVADDELRELRTLANRLELPAPTRNSESQTGDSDRLLSLHAKQSEIRLRTAELLDCLGLLPSLIDPTAQIRREGPGIVDKAAIFIAQVLERTGLFAPHWLPTLEDAHRILRQSRNLRELIMCGAKFVHAGGRRWLKRRQAVHRLHRSRNSANR